MAGLHSIKAGARLLIACLWAPLLPQPAAAGGSQERAPVRVAALNTILGEIAREVGGGDVVVTDLVKPGVDPHEYEPSPSDLRQVVDADLVLASGLGLESYLDRLVAATGTKARVVAVGDCVPWVLCLPEGGAWGEAPAEEVYAGRGERDPHWWHSIGNMRAAVGVVRDELGREAPERASLFAARAQAYDQRLAALKAWADGEMARLPAARRELVTSHDAFAYFARDFGFTIYPIAGFSPEAEVDARRLAALIEIIRGRKIPTVFAESSVNPDLIRKLVAETGVALGETLYGDGLGTADSDAGTYEAMYRHNVRAIVAGLAP